MKSFTITEINQHLQGELLGCNTVTITGAEQIEKAQTQQITLIGSRKYLKLWDTTQATAVIVSDKLNITPKENKAIIKVSNPDLAMGKVLALFAPDLPDFENDISPNATIHKTAKIGSNCKIGAGCYIGKDVVLADNVTLFPNVTILDNSTVGAYTTIWSGAVIRERSVIGKHCILHNNVSIGADGFGYRPAENGQGLIKIQHIGNVILEDYVEIGANSCVDRGKFSATKLGYGCKIDNLVQIGHNSVLGKFCIMAGSSGLAGSVTLGDGVIIGGSASIKDHTTIHSGAVVGGGSGVVADVAAGKHVLGYPAQDSREMLKQWVALRRLVK